MTYNAGKVLSVLSASVHVVACFLILAMMLQICIDVLLKYLTANHVPANIEIVSNYYMVGIAFLPLAFAEKRNGHISAEVLTRLMPLPRQLVAVAFAWALSILIYGVLTYRTFLDAEEKREIGAFIFSQGIRLDIWPAYYFLPIGFALMCLVLLYRLFVLLIGGNDGFSDGPPVQQDETLNIE